MGLIYIVTNKITQKQYVGQTIATLEQRKHSHLSDTDYNRDNVYFHNSIRKYGIENFIWEILEDGLPDEKLSERETFYIKKFDTFNRGYNLTLGGEGCHGYKHSEEMLRHLSEIKIGTKASLKTKEKMSESHKGKPPTTKGMKFSDETRKKMSESSKGKLHTQESKEKIRLANLGSKNPRFGKHQTAEHSKRQSDAQKQPVLQFTKDMKFIDRYDSVGDAAKAVNLTGNNISVCLHNKKRTARGFVWIKERDYWNI
jgi:group I intron endonuclease